MGIGRRFKTVVLCLVILFSVCTVSYAAPTGSIAITGPGEQMNPSTGIWDTGAITITLTVNGNTYMPRVPVQYGQFSTVDSIASALAASISSDCNSPVSAKSAPGGVIYFRARNGGDISQIAIINNGSISFGSGSSDLSIASTTTVATIGATQLSSGQSTAVSVQVSCGTNCGNVDYRMDGGKWQTVGLDSNGQASLPTDPSLSPGLHNVVVQYEGNGSYMASISNPVSFSISNSSTATQIYSYNISSYATNGNIAAYSHQYGNTVNETWSNIQHDGLNRLTGATQNVNGAVQNMCWSYDAFGDRTANVCNSSTPIQYNANNQDPNLQYDASGNVKNDGTNQYLYDAEGRICAVNYMAGTIPVMMQYLYDAEGQRVAKGTISSWSCDTTTNGFTETAGYVLGPDGEQITEVNGQGDWVHTNVFADGELIATYDQAGVHFHLSDWLGTRRVQVDPDYLKNNYPASFYQNLPFGEMVPQSQSLGATEHHFTGKEHDAESGLDYFGARHYSSTMGRFISPDPSGLTYADVTDPQSLNLYAYVRNHPLSFIDPDGLECVWDDGSYDSIDDPKTGNGDIDTFRNHSGCSRQGGTWIDHSYFANNGMADWSSQANQTLSDMITPSVTVDGSPNPWVDGVAGANPQATVPQTDPIQQLALGVVNFGIPNVCAFGLTARAGLPGSRLSFGVDANTQKGIRAAGGARIASLGGVQGSVSVKGKSVSATVSAPIPGTPFTAGVSTKGSTITSVNVGRSMKGVNVQAYADIGTFADPNCR